MSKRAVLYANDFEPVTIIELNDWAWQFLRMHGSVNISVQIQPETKYVEHCQVPTYHNFTVRIKAEKLVRGKEEALMLFTADDELAMLLKPAFLPGQYSEIQRRQSEAFAAGFIKAFLHFGG